MTCLCTYYNTIGYVWGLLIRVHFCRRFFFDRCKVLSRQDPQKLQRVHYRGTHHVRTKNHDTRCKQKRFKPSERRERETRSQFRLFSLNASDKTATTTTTNKTRAQTRVGVNEALKPHAKPTLPWYFAHTWTPRPWHLSQAFSAPALPPTPPQVPQS